MLDFNINMEFKPELALVSHSKIDRLVITSCALHYCGKDQRIISDFDDLCYNQLNGNNRGFGFLDIEVGFAGHTGVPYPKVYTKCFRLFTNNQLLIKPLKVINNTSDSKVSQRGETVIGFRYYFRNADEVEKIASAKKIMFDSFFALHQSNNTYGLACQLRKDGGKWTADYANTYRIYRHANIKWLND